MLINIKCGKSGVSMKKILVTFIVLVLSVCFVFCFSSCKTKWDDMSLEELETSLTACNNEKSECESEIERLVTENQQLEQDIENWQKAYDEQMLQRQRCLNEADSWESIARAGYSPNWKEYVRTAANYRDYAKDWEQDAQKSKANKEKCEAQLAENNSRLEELNARIKQLNKDIKAITKRINKLKK